MESSRHIVRRNDETDKGVFRRLSSLDVYQESIEEFDAALFEMTFHPSFPQGLTHLSSATLRRARGLLLKHLLHNLPLRDSHLRAFLTAIIEMDRSDLSETEHDCLNANLNNLTLQNRICTRDTITSSQMNSSGGNLPCHAYQVLRKEWIFFLMLSEPKYFVFVPRSADALVDVATWNPWKSRALSYFLDKRTIRLVSGASLIFSGTNAQWRKVFGQLSFSEKSSNNDSHETIELLLLGCISSRWNCVTEHLMSVSYDSVTISKQYHVLANSVFGISQSFHQTEEIIKSMEGGILDYLMGLLGGQLNLLWKSSPALTAVSLPSWSTLFRLYLSEIETQFKGNPSMIRWCSCIQDSNEHNDCELAERIWCLYIFHVCGSQMIHGACCA
ncbi:hypothetical protein CRYUN_Cryun01aG0155500 [Craigia yunnanensis]